MDPIQPAPTLDITTLKLNRTGLIRTIITTCVACSGGLMWGYDSGVISGILSLESFKDHFHVTASNSSAVSSNAVSLLQAGGFFGALFISPACQRFGRRLSMIFAAIVFLCGAVMQIAGTGGLPLFYVGRVIAGLGVGGVTCCVPTYVAEMLPKKIRGTMMGTWQFWIVTGVTISYWTDYGVNERVNDPNSQWRIPLGVQMIPAVLLILGTIILKESPRWLAKRGEDDKALANLAYMRGLDVGSPEVQAEYQEIYQALLHETEVTGGVTWKEMFLPGNRKRAIIGFSLMAAQQFSGTNAIGYYAPQIFEAVGISSTSTGLFATGLYGVVKMVMTMALCLFAIERFGRRMCLLVGGFFMGLFMLIIGVLLKTHPPNPDSAVLSSASYAMVVFIYLYVTAYCFSWGPVPWIYASEIFPNRIREYCVALCASSQWLFNFVVTQFSPYALKSLGWGIFMLFMGFNFLNCIGVWFLPETTGLALEEMDTLFGAPTAIDNAKVRESAVQNAYDAKQDVEFVEDAEQGGSRV
ncbi:Snf3p [Sugiyamaella lignohabitans]|uniref:Snf3p n=1 Tax=Sugiyamaella lignohabitans TaxID=796027 RepID=A0A167DDU9_9ASCO|nr:Snf3p [Sugiyamaella lignohabitans]ANB12803.1 Snf3p [Sugiyamaella lignohabitans]